MEGTGMTLIKGLRQAEERLARIHISEPTTLALASAARDLDAKIVEVLSQPPGQDHSVPWLRTGALRASIGHDSDATVAVIGSSSDVAVDQELGTRTVPPRPFLAPTAATAADDIATAIAATLAHYLAGR
jgi:phage gpG-like protein